MSLDLCPPAKRQKLENDAFDQPSRIKNNYATNVIRYLDGRTADVYFVCGEKCDRIPAHKMVLSMASKVFDRDLNGEWDKKEEIELSETSTEAFKDFLQFFYLNEVTLQLDHIGEVLGLAHKYQMLECVELCVHFWMENWSVNDICGALERSIHFELNDFKAFCEHKIIVHAEQVFKTVGFLRCSRSVLDHILRLDGFLCDETIILGACFNWAKENEHLRCHLKTSLYNIRYGSMKIGDFLGHMDANNWSFANVDEYKDIIRIFSGATQLKTGKFNAEPRTAMNLVWNETGALKCKLITNSTNLQQTICADTYVTAISSNLAVLLGGFFVAPMQHMNDDSGTPPIAIDVTIKEQREESNLAAKTIRTIKLRTSEMTEEFVDLRHCPVAIKPNHKYFIEITLESSNITYRRFEFETDIQLDKNTAICVEPLEIDFFIRSFLFNLL